MEDQENYEEKQKYRIHNWSEARFTTYLKEILSDGYEHIHKVNLEKGGVRYLVPERIFELIKLSEIIK